MDIIITKDLEDIRENRNRILVKGTVFTTTKEQGEKYIKTGKAKEKVPAFQPVRSVKNEKELAKHLEE